MCVAVEVVAVLEAPEAGSPKFQRKDVAFNEFSVNVAVKGLQPTVSVVAAIAVGTG